MSDRPFNTDLSVCTQHEYGCEEPAVWRIEFWNCDKDPDVDPISAVAVCAKHLNYAVSSMEAAMRFFEKLDGPEPNTSAEGGFRVVPNLKENAPRYIQNSKEQFSGEDVSDEEAEELDRRLDDLFKGGM